MRIEITNYDEDYVSVDFEDGETLVNFNFRIPDLLKLKKLVEEAMEGLKTGLETTGDREK